MRRSQRRLDEVYLSIAENSLYATYNQGGPAVLCRLDHRRNSSVGQVVAQPRRPRRQLHLPRFAYRHRRRSPTSSRARSTKTTVSTTSAVSLRRKADRLRRHVRLAIPPQSGRTRRPTSTTTSGSRDISGTYTIDPTNVLRFSFGRYDRAAQTRHTSSTARCKTTWPITTRRTSTRSAARRRVIQ